MNNIDKRYQELLQDILDNGVRKEDRTGTGTISVFGRQIRHKMSEGFPLLTTKKMAWKTMVTELLWFLRGDTNIKFLVDNGCHIWDGDAYKNYCKIANSVEEPDYEIHVDDPNQNCTRLMTTEEFINKIKTDDEFAKKFGELGPIYGAQWRSWRVGKGIETSLPHPDGGNIYEAGSMYIDQIANLINDLKTNPDSRRLMVSAWNVGELDKMVLPPCHYGFQVYTRELSLAERLNLVSTIIGEEKIRTHEDNLERVEKLNIPTRAISLMWNQRSVDTFLGLPFNIASYGLLLEIIAKSVNMVPDELIGNLGDVHLYSNHIEQAKEQIGREMTWEEQVQWVMRNTDVEMENLYIVEEIAKDSTPKHTRQPYQLPGLNHLKTPEFYESLSEDISLISHLEPSDFSLVNYQSHPAIKAPLSN
jgi:thymidylate synthase